VAHLVCPAQKEIRRLMFCHVWIEAKLLVKRHTYSVVVSVVMEDIDATMPIKNKRHTVRCCIIEIEPAPRGSLHQFMASQANRYQMVCFISASPDQSKRLP
jgi:hypothetical protein